MLKIPFVFISLEPAKDWKMNTEQGERSGTSYKVNVLIDETLVVAKASQEAHKALESEKRGADIVGDWNVKKRQSGFDLVLLSLPKVK